MTKKPHDYTVILQNLVDSFVSIKVDLSCIGPTLTNMLWMCDIAKLKISFSNDKGAIKSIERLPTQNTNAVGGYIRTVSSEQVDIPTDELDKQPDEQFKDYQSIIYEDEKLLSEWIESLFKTVQQLQQALDDLPHEVHDLLSKVHGSSWRLLVRRECLDRIYYWPGKLLCNAWEYSYTAADRLRFPTRMDKLLEYAAATDPNPFWQEASQKLDSYVDDVVAVSGEFSVNTQKPAKSGGRPKSEKVKAIEDAIRKENLAINGITERFRISADYARKIKSRMNKGNL